MSLIGVLALANEVPGRSACRSVLTSDLSLYPWRIYCASLDVAQLLVHQFIQGRTFPYAAA